MKRDGLKATGGGGFITEISFFLAMIGSILLAIFAIFGAEKEEQKK